MKKQPEKEELSIDKRFEIKVEDTIVLSTDNVLEAGNKIVELQRENKPLIIVLDMQEKKSSHYKKTVHEKNYRIVAGNFEADNTAKNTVEIKE